MTDTMASQADGLLPETLMGALDECAVHYPGLEGCALGIAMRNGMECIVAYDYDKVIAVLMRNEGGPPRTHLEALDNFCYNVLGSWVGEGTPMFVQLASNWKEGADSADGVIEAAIQSIRDALSEDPHKDWRESLSDAADALGGLLENGDGRQD